MSAHQKVSGMTATERYDYLTGAIEALWEVREMLAARTDHVAEQAYDQVVTLQGKYRAERDEVAGS